MDLPHGQKWAREVFSNIEYLSKRLRFPGPMTRAIAYLRVSTDKQADKGVSLEDQRVKVQQYAALYDLELTLIVEETGSASSLDRPKLQETLALLKDGKADALLIVKLDRLTRSVADLGELLTDYFAVGKSDLLSVTEHIDTRTAAGRLVLNVIASVSQWEREVIAERTKAALKYKKDRGDRLGAPKFGWRVETSLVDGQPFKTLVEVPEEQAVLSQVKSLHREGRSQRAIASELATRGVKGRKGFFSQTQIHRMLSVSV